jgi:hypothetical protein
MSLTPLPMLLSAAMALAPLGSGQQARLTAWLDWAAAYSECYQPAPFSLRIDRGFTADCVERALRRQEGHGPPEQRAATRALIAATPQLIRLLNAPIAAAGGGDKAAGIAPVQPPGER